MSFQVVKSQVLNHNNVFNEHEHERDKEESDTEPDYVFDVKLSCDSKSFIVSSSDRAIHLYDFESFSLKLRISAHKDRISNIVFSRHSPDLFWTSSDDQTVKFWNLKSPLIHENKPMIIFKFEEEIQAFAVNHDDTLLVVGVGCDILFLDVRQAMNTKSTVISSSSLRSCELGRYSDMHSDIVTQLEFSPNHHNILLSGAEDGLICVYDTAADESEEAVVSILNVGCPIRKFGFFGPNLEGVYALSTVETASFWHYPSAQRLAHFEDLREKLSIDYLVDCLYDQSNSSLQLLTGSYEGNGWLIMIQPGEYTTTGLGFQHHHSSMLRCCVPIIEVNKPVGSNITYITGGEDGRILLWQKQDVEARGTDAEGNRVELFGSSNEVVESMEEDQIVEESNYHELETARPMIPNLKGVKLIVDESTHGRNQKPKFSKDAKLKHKQQKRFHSGLRHKPY